MCHAFLHLEVQAERIAGQAYGVTNLNVLATIILPGQDIDEFGFQPFGFDCVSHNHSIFLEIDTDRFSRAGPSNNACSVGKQLPLWYIHNVFEGYLWIARARD
jgi:hypothetical protein